MTSSKKSQNLRSNQKTKAKTKTKINSGLTGKFELIGNKVLENFFNEYVIDIIEKPKKYERFKINFPGSIILHGPPGCGKTYAVENTH